MSQEFTAYLGKMLQAGSVDAKTKEMIAVGLSIGVHCAPCTRHHVHKALEMGVTREQLDEIADIAMGFGGCRAKVLWDEVMKEIE